MESREIWRLGRRRTVGGLIAFGLVFSACSAEAGNDASLAFDDTDVVDTGNGDVARAVGADEAAELDRVDATVEDVAAEEVVIQGVPVEAEPAGDAVPVEDGAAEDVPVEAEPVDDAAIDEGPVEEPAREPVVETNANTPAVGADSELVGTTGVTARELMRNLGEALEGTTEILGEPERTDDGGTFSFTLTDSAEATSRVDVTFSYITSADDAELIVGHEATGVVVNPS